jgi:hypothetical protein
LEKFCKDYSKVSIDFALGNCSAETAQARQEILKKDFVFEHSGFINKLVFRTRDFLDYIS